MSERLPIYIGNPADIFVEGMLIRRNKLPDLEAEMTVTLRNASDGIVSGADSLAMTLDSDDKANYTGMIRRAVTLTLRENANYTAVIAGDDQQWEIPLKAVRRTR